MTKRLRLPYVVTIYNREDFAILDVLASEYVVCRIKDRRRADIACRAMNACRSEFNEDGKLIAIDGVRLEAPHRLVGGTA